MLCAYVLAGELAEAGGDHERVFAAYECVMAEPARRSRAFTLGAAKSTIPGSPAGVWALAQGARLVSVLPAGVSRALARLNTKGVGLHDSMSRSTPARDARPLRVAAHRPCTMTSLCYSAGGPDWARDVLAEWDATLSRLTRNGAQVIVVLPFCGQRVRPPSQDAPGPNIEKRRYLYTRWAARHRGRVVCRTKPGSGRRSARFCLWVPTTSSTSRDLGVFVDDAAETVVPSDLELV